MSMLKALRLHMSKCLTNQPRVSHSLPWLCLDLPHQATWRSYSTCPRWQILGISQQSRSLSTQVHETARLLVTSHNCNWTSCARWVSKRRWLRSVFSVRNSHRSEEFWRKRLKRGRRMTKIAKAIVQLLTLDQTVASSIISCKALAVRPTPSKRLSKEMLKPSCTLMRLSNLYQQMLSSSTQTFTTTKRTWRPTIFQVF